MVKQLTDLDVKKLAKSAGLTLSESEIESLILQLEQTIEYIENLEELDISEVEPTYHVTNSKNITFEDGIPADRTLPIEKVMQNAPNEPVNGKFRVPKILDKGGDN